LNQKSTLLRVYTQNIDGLEEQAGVDKTKVVYAHGSLLNATCMKCNAKYSAQDIASDVKAGIIPLCQRVKEKRTKARKDTSAQKLTDKPQNTRTLRKRSFQHYSEVDGYCVPTKEGVCGGIVKPDITFFGEKLGSHVGLSLQNDWSKADALIVMGTSLSV
jgi:NAD-dependent SIR2 family protein deacetylase